MTLGLSVSSPTSPAPVSSQSGSGHPIVALLSSWYDPSTPTTRADRLASCITAAEETGFDHEIALSEGQYQVDIYHPSNPFPYGRAAHPSPSIAFLSAWSEAMEIHWELQNSTLEEETTL